MDRFVHLRVRSHLSLLAGGSSIEALMTRTRDLGQPAMAVTDVRSLHGAVLAEKASKKIGVRLVLGCILPVQQGARVWTPTVLLRNTQGWRSMCRVLSQVAIDDRSPVPLEALLSLEPEGVFVLAGPSGDFFREGDPLEPDVLRGMHDRFGAALHVELCDAAPHHTPRLAAARTWALRQGLSSVVTNDVHAMDSQGLIALEVLTRVAAKSWLHDGKPRSTDQDVLKSRSELEEVFPEDGAALDATLELAQQCDVRVGSKVFSFPRSEPPAELAPDARWAWLADWFPVPSGFSPPPSRLEALREERDPQVPVDDLPLYFGWFAREGLRARLRRQPQLPLRDYEARLEEEIAAIRAMGFAAYMLIVSEFTAWAKDHGVPVGPGRGSVAGSLVAWAMRVTDVDPIRFGLVFERFLNPARVSIPDVDTDFGVVDRARVIAHVVERYGADRVGQIATYGTLAVKGAAKEAARVLGVRPLDAEEITRELEAARVETASEWMESAVFANRRRVDGLYRRLMDLALLVEGAVRQIGVHAAGVVVTPEPCTQWVPVYRSADGGQVLGTDMDGVDAMGLVKFDFLGLENLDTLRLACDLVERGGAPRPDLDDIPLDDPEVLHLLGRGSGLGLFQVESFGMRALLRRIQPSSIEDLIALLALYRPGPLATGMVDDYIERKHGRARVETLDPRLTEVLRSTYGVFVYQEQVMRAAQVLAGYSMAEADLLRRAIAKKKPEEMAEQHRRFISGCEAGGMDPAVAEAIFAQINGFAEYCFNRSHSASYALICWQTAWMKAHHRMEYMAAVLTAKAGDAEALAPVLAELREDGLEVRGPDIYRSEITCSVELDNEARFIRLGLCMVRGLGPAALDALRADRSGLPREETELIRALRARGLTRSGLQSLVAAGALDTVGARPALSARVDQMASENAGASPLQAGLFALLPAPPPIDATWTWQERIDNEQRALGVAVSGHILDRYGSFAAQVASHSISDVPSLRRGEAATLVGSVVKIHRVSGRRRDITYVALSDRTGVLEVVLRDSIPDSVVRGLEVHQALRVRGALDRPGDDGRFVVEDLDDLEALRERAGRQVVLVADADVLHALASRLDRILKQHPGEARVMVRARRPHYEALLELPHRVMRSRALFQDLDRLHPIAVQ